MCNQVYLIDTINIKNITITNTARSNYYNQKNSLTLEEIKIYIKSCFIKNSDNICIHSIDCNLVNINIYGNNKGERLYGIQELMLLMECILLIMVIYLTFQIRSSLQIKIILHYT